MRVQIEALYAEAITLGGAKHPFEVWEYIERVGVDVPAYAHAIRELEAEVWGLSDEQKSEQAKVAEAQAMLWAMQSNPKVRPQEVGRQRSKVGSLRAAYEAMLIDNVVDLPVMHKLLEGNPAKNNGKKREPKPRKEATLHPCICGCGLMVKGRYAQGHDAKVHGWIGQLEKGKMTQEEFDAKGIDTSDFMTCSCCGSLVDKHASGMGPVCRKGKCKCQSA